MEPPRSLPLFFPSVRNIIVMTGAGISTGAGIPDFRTKGTGLYDNLQKFNLPYAEAIFDIDYFETTPAPFYALAKELYPGRHLPTKTHYFLRLLDEKNLLLRNFTQNIDTLERLSGLKEERIVEAHGSFATASCIGCHLAVASDWLKKKIEQGEVARCEQCQHLIKPDITFFGQSLPERFHDHMSATDLLIVIGTSLKVHPFAGLIDSVPGHVPRLLVNMEKAGVHASPHSGFDFEWKRKRRDVAFLGSCDDGVERMAELLGWKDALESLYTLGHASLKAQWKAATDPQEEDEDEETTPEPAQNTVDVLTDALAKVQLVSEEEEKDPHISKEKRSKHCA
ncbi:DHS-like NAD/FAD-binding domain-containing protein [Spinellus fusiger]|nr:DHS-like NAD/FAD-binding domain-containing protein [Spinellus fusiger]